MAKRDVSSDLAENAKVAYPQSSDVRFVIFNKDRDIPMLELKNRQYIMGASTQPADDEALYFVAVGDGSGRHVFSKTLAEHEAAVRAYIRRYRAQYGPK